MVDHSEDKRIAERYVREVVDSLISSSTRLDVKNPLLQLTLVEEFLINPDLPYIENANEYALQSIFIDLILKTFDRQCHALEIPIPESVSAVKGSQFRQNLSKVDSAELWGLALLFTSYVKADWNIPVSEFSRTFNLVDRTVRRYREIAISKITKVLIDEEWHARIRRRKARILAQLPGSLQPEFIGRDKEISTIVNIVERKFESKFIISGIAGVGKSTCVEYYVHSLLESNESSFDLIWINSPTSISQVKEIIIDRISPYNSLSSIREILFVNPAIVILDGIDSFADSSKIDELLYELEYAQVIVTSRQKIPLLATQLAMTLSGLSQKQAELLLKSSIGDNLLEEMKSTKTFDRLYSYSNGNPLALLVGGTYFSLGLFSEISKKSLDQIYQDLYQNCSTALRSAWIALALCPPEWIQVKKLLALFDPTFSLVDLNDLVKYHVADYTEDASSISLVSSASFYIWEVTFTANHSGADQLISVFFENFTKNIVATFPLPLFLLHHIVFVDSLKIPDEILVSALEVLLELTKGTSNREIPRLWYEIYDHFPNKHHSTSEIRLFFSQLLLRYGKWVDAKTELNALIKDCGGQGDFSVQSRALMDLARLYKMIGDYDKAIVILNRIDRFPNLQRFITPDHLIQKARIAVDRRQLAEVDSLFAQIPQNFRSDVLRCEVAIMRMQYDDAMEILGNCFERAGNKQHELSHLHVLLGRILEGQGALNDALQQYFIGLTYFSDNHEIANLARVWTNVGVIYYRLEELETSAQYFVKALRVQSALGDQLGLALTRHNYNLLPPDLRIMD